MPSTGAKPILSVVMRVLHWCALLALLPGWIVPGGTFLCLCPPELCACAPEAGSPAGDEACRCGECGQRGDPSGEDEGQRTPCRRLQIDPPDESGAPEARFPTPSELCPVSTPVLEGSRPVATRTLVVPAFESGVSPPGLRSAPLRI